MDKYELMTIVNASVSQEEKDAVIKEATDVISKAGAKVINSAVYLEKHKFSFLMNKCTHGTYYLINVESPKDAVTKIKQSLKMNENIIRSLLIKSEQV